ALELGRLLQPRPDRLHPVRVLDHLAVMRAIAFAIEVALANHVGGKPEALRGDREDLFDRDHGLRTTEAPERGLRGLVRPAHAPAYLDRRQVIGIVAVKQRSPHYRF